ncbi:PolC-type DNA polymerase III [candidate division KSB1 bacterium]
MQDKIFHYVAHQNREVELKEIAERLFRINEGPEALIRRTIQPIVGSDSRFEFSNGSNVVLSELGREYKNLYNTTFVAVDCETTGTNLKKDKITEIAGIKIEEGVIVDSFETLINPGKYIPDNIKRLTGISNSMVTDYPTIGEVLPDFVEFLGDSVFVAHNYHFDMKFINVSLYREGMEQIENTALCTYQLGRKLFPEYKKLDLGTLSKKFGIVNDARHRAGGDAAACAKIFIHILKKLPEANIFSLEELVQL